ncbi:MAG: histidine kinase dimerization/phospho-acceptor domain-containing protein [bacterium]
MTKNLEILWVVQLRWVELAAQLLLVVAIAVGTGLEVPLSALLSLLAVGAMSNAGLWMTHGRVTKQSVLIGTALAFDIGLLTAGLYLSGGPMNPFSFLYVVPVALGAVVLSGPATFGLCVLSIGGYGLLYATADDAHMHHHASMQMHLEGMWVAMATSAVLVAYFVVALQKKLRSQEVELERARDREARYDKLASLTTLAAGAAHELATPLSTIAVTARELELGVGDEQWAAEAKIIGEETRRCRSILQRLSAQSGDMLGEATVDFDVLDIVQTASKRLGNSRIEIHGEPQRGVVALEPVTEAISSLLQNALDASQGPVVAEVVGDNRHVTVSISNQGNINDDVLSRCFDPF